MPGMFSRRRGSSVTPPTDRNTHASAAVAASQAFTGQPLPRAGLSSAAAAAALRSHTTSPELVGNIQTKRMVRRNSNSSNGSGSVIANGTRNGRAPLQRTNSGGSMSERSFRSPSPGKPNGAAPARTAAADAPPVPPMPAKAQKPHQRSASMEPPQRVLSPTPAAGQRYASVDRANIPPLASSAKAKRLSNVNEADELERARNTKNFSRPMSPPLSSSVTSNAAKRYTHGTGSWFTQAAGDSPQSQGTPSDAASLQQSSVGQQSAAPLANMATKKNRISSAPGSHLAQANHAWNRDHSGTRSASSGDSGSVMVYDPNSRSFVQSSNAQQSADPPSPDSPKRNEVYDPHTRSFVPKSQAGNDDTASQADSSPASVSSATQAKKKRPVVAAVDTSLEPPPRNPARISPSSTPPTSPRAAGMLGKQPSVIREDPDAEQETETAGTWRKDYRILGSTTDTSPTPAKSYKAPPKAVHQRSASLDVPRADENVGRGRVASQSPGRSAHFSASPILEPERHVPPARDVSPAKSALKHSSSTSATPRTAGFALPPAAGVAYAASEASEDGASQDGMSSGKKKGVRVSFDDQPIQIAQPPAQPLSPAIDEDEDDAFMRPRPMLPSFGSVRKGRVEPEVPQKVTEMPPERNAASSDHAIGGILRNRDQSLPLPPEVTSKDSAGYASDESSEAEVPAVSAAAAPARAEPGQYAPANVGEPSVQDFAAELDSALHPGLEDLEVPDINLLPPTPGFDDDAQKQLKQSEPILEQAAKTELPQPEPSQNESSQTATALVQPTPEKSTEQELTKQEEDLIAMKKKNRRSMEGISVPGGWADEDEVEEPTAAEHTAVQPTASSTTGRRPSAEDSLATQTITPIALPAKQQELSDIDEDSDAAEFSDAVEDPEDLEDGGFASLDAIVHSPIATSSPVETRTAASVPADMPPTKQIAKEVEGAETEAPSGGDWGQATAYWSQLSKERRLQIEREHFSSDDEASPPPATTAAKKTKPLRQGVPAATALPKQSAQPAMRKSMRGPPEPAPAPAAASARDGVQLRSSMRSGGAAGGMATTMRSGPQPRRPQSEYIEPRGTLQKKNIRPVSAVGPGATSTVTAVQSQQSPGAKNQDSSFPIVPTNQRSVQQRQSTQPQVSERLQRELSKADDSDSESSFRKRRRAGSVSTYDSAVGGRYNMKRSMRGQPADPRPAPAERRPTSPEMGRKDKSSFSIRSLSPTGSFFGRNKASNKASKIQPQASGPRTTLRGPPAPQSKARSTPAAAPRAAPAPPAQSRFKSRFNDSDDEDEDRRSKPTRYRSRFADSDDDDEPESPRVMRADLAPVRGIPRRQGQDDGDSTDLDSEDEQEDPRKASRNREKMPKPLVPAPGDVEKAMAAARRNLGMTNRPAAPDTSEGGALQKGSLRGPKPAEQAEPKSKPEDISFAPPDKKKKGFMGSILRRNRNSSSSVQQLSQTNSANAPTSPAVVASPSSPQVSRVEAPSSPASPSVGKLVRRQSDQPKMTRQVSGMSGTTSPPAVAESESPQVARKSSQSWPLPPPIPDDDEDSPVMDRPNTSDGNLPQTERPDLGPRSKSGQPLSKRVTLQAGEEGSEPGEREGRAVYSLRTGKKKKFGALRRAFRLDD